MSAGWSARPRVPKEVPEREVEEATRAARRELGADISEPRGCDFVVILEFSWIPGGFRRVLGTIRRILRGSGAVAERS